MNRLSKNVRFIDYMIIPLKQKKLTFWENIYLFEIIRGLFITGRHLLHNIFNRQKMMTCSWPEETKHIETSYRAEHRLMLRDDDSIRCTACMLCATVCPANCITIEAAEGSTPAAEKFAKNYSIDLLRCVFCGYCVEACPCDAIRMDTQKLVSACLKRKDFLKDIAYLKNNHGDKSPYSEARYP